MYNGIERIEGAIEEIERNITGDIDYEKLASGMALSVYEFRRIFSFIVGCPLSEYVRRRRLSLAACELMTDSDISIREISEKYGYSTESAFSKAFREMHGFSPLRCQKGNVEIKLFTRPKFEISVSGRSTVPFSVIKDIAYGIRGLSMTSPHTDTCCCDTVWSEFYDKGYDGDITGDRIYAAYRDESGEVLCTIGDRCDTGMGVACGESIPETAWACFRMNTTDDDTVNARYGEILYEVLPSASMRRREDIPTVEVFPLDMSENNFEWEIRIPIEQENTK